MKSTLLLALALFLISAPAPDARDIAEMTSNFIVPSQLPGLEASEASPLNLENLNHSSVMPQPDADRASEELAAQEESSDSAEQTVQSIKEKVQGRPSTQS